ncbi:MAG: DNA internalization-related competence protein ComEC/Rec2, partial [Ghiorsea sp.]
WLEQARNHIRQALAPLDTASQGILSALLLADRSMIPLPIDDAFSASGATHLLAISGLHVGLVAGWGFMLCWWLITRRENWIVALPVRSLALSMGLILAMAYATLAGWPIPAQRAFIMLLAAVLAWWFRASQVPLNSMLAAFLLITLLDPAAVLSVSLWLSFVATTSLLIWAGSQQKKGESMLNKTLFWLKSMFWVSILASLATLPLIGFIFERLPAWSLLANALLVPIYALWVLPLALLGELMALLGLESIATPVFKLASIGIDWGNIALLNIYNLPAGNLWLRADKPLYPALLGIFLLICGYLWLKSQRKWACSLLCLTLLAYSSTMLAENEQDTAQFHVFDVGQGASALLHLPHFSLLIDAPGKKRSKFNGGSIAASNARALGLLHLNAVALTHAQSDHAGGVLRLLAAMNSVNELWLADVPDNHHYSTIQIAIKRIKQQGGKVRWLQQGDSIMLKDGNHIDVLWPPKGYHPSNGNNTSLVLAVTLNTGHRLLLPGDMQKQVEKQITDDFIQPFDVILMPHHGSKTSSTAAFVQAVRPQIAIAQTGYKNHYGFPKKEVVKRYEQSNSKILNTANGAVSLSFTKDTIKIAQFSNKRPEQATAKRLAIQHFFHSSEQDLPAKQQIDH